MKKVSGAGQSVVSMTRFGGAGQIKEPVFCIRRFFCDCKRFALDSADGRFVIDDDSSSPHTR